MDTRKFTMAYGDRIYARLCLNGEKTVEFMTDHVSGMAELLGELRSRTRSLKGLCRLYVRNYSRGWSSERPLMLYAAAYSHGHNVTTAKMNKPYPHVRTPWMPFRSIPAVYSA